MSHTDRRIDELLQIPVTSELALTPGQFLASARRIHGPIFRTVDYTGEKRLFVVGPEANRMVMVSEHARFSNYRGWNETDSVVRTLGRGMIFIDGPEHNRLRLAASSVFSESGVAAWVPRMSEIIAARVSRWSDGSIIDLYEEAYSITFQLSAVLLIGLTDELNIARLLTLFHELMSLNIRGLDDINAAALVGRARRQQISLEIAELIRPVIGRDLHSMSSALSSLAAAGHCDGSPLSADELVAHANTFLLAGHITTSSVCAFLLHQLATDEKNCDRVLMELRAINVSPREIPFKALESMRGLDYTVKEAERMFAPVPALPRGVIEDVVFGGFLIPKGQTLFCSIAGAHMSDDLFRDPGTFDPDRFAAPRAEHVKTPYSLVGFGAGPRRCLGQTMARTEIKLIVIHVLSRFALEPLAECQAVPLYHPVLSPLHGLRVRLSAV